MTLDELYYTGSKKLRKLNLDSIDFSKTNVLENGEYFDLYNLSDKSGNTIPGYVIKRLRRRLLNRIIDTKWIIRNTFKLEDPHKKKFDIELKALTLLKEKRIAPDLIYFNSKLEYFIFEKMDFSFSNFIKTRKMTAIMAHLLFKLIKRFYKTPILHTSLTYKNVWYSNKLADWRIIGWSNFMKITNIYQNSFKVLDDFENSEGIMFNLMLYTKIELEENPDDILEWKSLKVKIFNFINSNFSLQQRKKINMFSKDYQDKILGSEFT